MTSTEQAITGKFDRSVSLISWAYNEECLIEEFLRRAHALMTECVEDFEIVVIDDGSTDKTREIGLRIAEELSDIRIISNDRNRNVGYSCTRAVKEARKEYLFWQTTDWHFETDDLREHLELLKSYDVVAGVRRKPVPQRSLPGRALNTVYQLFGKHLTKRSDTIWKGIVSVINYMVLRLFFGVPLSDFQNMVFYPSKFVQQFNPMADSAFINPELLILSHWKGASIVEVPISASPRYDGEAKGTRVNAIYKAVRDILVFWFTEVALGRRGLVTPGGIKRASSDD